MHLSHSSSNQLYYNQILVCLGDGRSGQTRLGYLFEAYVFIGYFELGVVKLPICVLPETVEAARWNTNC